MNLLWPSMSRARLAASVRIAAIGAAVAAAYGVVHDQISFTISPEYFTKMKFEQFAWADPRAAGAPDRVFVAEIGALATWWVGAIAGWCLARVGFRDPAAAEKRDIARALGVMLGVTGACGLVGALVGWVVSRGDLVGWSRWREGLGLRDVPSFVIVAWLHAASYVGGGLGAVVAVVRVRRMERARGVGVGSVPGGMIVFCSYDADRGRQTTHRGGARPRG
jgi:hypothetical protein